MRKRRLDLGLRQSQVAKHIGCSEATIVNWEVNRNQPQVKHLAKVAQFLGYFPSAKCDKMAQRLVTHRLALGLTQENFARELEVDPSTLAKWERGIREPKGAYLDRVNRIVS